ncbi:hypothetical protein JCGZ_11037 [Jatropha curcas]|uniref:Aminotransferase-like plant mobile domain-containing protein n=1 Tax=Jatropha curcas TaxID=180498 RepID=A0A067KG03_JATCU|nr:hypothetical protein JCGZ_11037 [Jatropha curcas]
MGRSNYKELLCALAERWWDTTNTFHFSWGELTLTPVDFSVISEIPFGIRPIELYDDWRTEISPDRMDMRAGRQMTLTAAHTEGIPHVELLMGGDYDEFCGISLMPPIGSRLDCLQGPVPSLPLGTHSSRASGPSRAPRAILEATGPLHPDLANLRLPYSISYFVPDNPPAFREVSLESIDRLTLPSEDITEVPVGLVNQMMELVLEMQQELPTAWTQIAFDDQRRRRPRR